MAQDTLVDKSPELADADGGKPLPVCLTRDNLTSPYVPRTSYSLLAAVVALSLVFVLISIHRLNHTDLWGHLNFGRWIVTHGGLPDQDPFAAEPLPGPATNVPWLSQVAGYLVYQRLGAEGLVLVHAMLATLSTGLLMWAIQRRGLPLLCGVAGGVAAILLAAPVVGTIRPQLCGMVGVPLVLVALGSADRNRWWPWLLAAVFAVWANLHGSFAVGLLLLGLEAAGRTVTAWFVRRKPAGAGAAPLPALREVLPSVLRDASVQSAWLALLLAVAASCLNPLGPWLLLEVASFGRHAPLSAISEWRELTLWSMSGGLFFGSLAVTALVCWASPRRPRLTDVLVLVVFGLLTLSAMRMLTWWALVWPWAMAPCAYAAWQRWVGSPAAGRASSPREASMRTLLALAIVFAALLAAPPSRALLFNAPRGEARVTGQGTPWYVADELVRRQAEGRLVAPMDWADYLIWKTEGRIQPLVYSHVHLLGDDTWNDYQRLAAGDPQWLDLVQQHRLKFVVVDRQRHRQLARVVQLAERSDSPPVRIIYRDQRCFVAEVL
ncbi:MAG: hypothetical protein J5I93_16790 [Pirellulaceae bacterium]|nr:hypothetical protein [Pirellulaceae bacterium]